MNEFVEILIEKLKGKERQRGWGKKRKQKRYLGGRWRGRKESIKRVSFGEKCTVICRF